MFVNCSYATEIYFHRKFSHGDFYHFFPGLLPTKEHHSRAHHKFATMGGGYDYYSAPKSKSSSYSKPSKSSAPVSTPTSAPPEAPALNDNEKQVLYNYFVLFYFFINLVQAMLSSFVHSADKTGIDVVFSFDTTGSMYPCLEEVRTKLQEITKRLVKDIPNIRIALIAHGILLLSPPSLPTILHSSLLAPLSSYFFIAFMYVARLPRHLRPYFIFLLLQLLLLETFSPAN
jgi:hypothetical protein